MSPQNIVHAKRFTDISGSGLLIGSLLATCVWVQFVLTWQLAWQIGSKPARLADTVPGAARVLIAIQCTPLSLIPLLFACVLT